MNYAESDSFASHPGLPRMHLYHFFFFDKDKHIRFTEIFEADALGEAVDKAHVILQEWPQYRTAEIWEGGRRLYRVDEPV
jgi:hypothetical protein